MEPNIPSESDDDIVQQLFDDLLRACRYLKSPKNIDMLHKAYHFAEQAHRGVKRKTGEPYITHPLEVAKISAKILGLGVNSIISALLHDVVEDTAHTLDEIRQEFGDETASIIYGLTKIEDVYDNNLNLQIENYRHLLQTIPQDLQVILIKLADRLHNMRTLHGMPRNKQLKKAGETKYVYVPLAHRLGLFDIKAELEDLSFKYLEPENYQQVEAMTITHYAERLNQFKKFRRIIWTKLREAGITCSIRPKAKSVFSTYKDLRSKQVSFDEFYNFLAIQIIFKTPPDSSDRDICYKIYAIITDHFPPKNGRLRDWTNNPRTSGYRALHADVMGSDGHWLEIHILSREMNEVAKKGYALKIKSKDEIDGNFIKWLSILEEQLKEPDADIETVIPINASDISVFTPKGHIITLPINSTILDFAFEIHTDLGYHCACAKVNNQLVPRSYKLEGGEQVEIITIKKQIPERDWVNLVITPKAKTNLKRYFKDEDEVQIIKGKELLNEILTKFQLTFNDKILKKISLFIQIRNVEDLFYKIGTGIVKADDLDQIFNIKFNQNPTGGDGNVTISPEVKSPVNPTIVITQNLSYAMAGCCNPVKGDNAYGHMITDSFVIIHKSSCKKVADLCGSDGDAMLPVEWRLNESESSYVARLKMKGLDRKKLVADVVNIISNELDVNMRGITVKSQDGIFVGSIELYIRNMQDIEKVIEQLRGVDGMKELYRAEDSD